MKKNITYVERTKIEELIAASGLPTSEKKGWTQVGSHGTKGPRMYVPKTKRVGRIDCAGLSSEGLNALGGESFGSITHQVDFSGDEASILNAVSAALDQLASLPAFEPKPRAPRAKRDSQPAEGTVQAAPADGGRAARLETIRRVAAEKGVPVSAELEPAQE